MKIFCAWASAIGSTNDANLVRLLLDSPADIPSGFRRTKPHNRNLVILAIIAILAANGELIMPAAQSEHLRVPLTRFHNNTGEFLDLATKQPVILTSHGRDRHVIADSDYFRHLEQVAHGMIADYMRIEATSSPDMTEADREALANARPSDSEFANDRWEG